MSDITFKIGDKVKIIDLNTVAEVASISDDGTQFTVKYNDAGGQEQTEVVAADKLEAATEPETPAAPAEEAAPETPAAPEAPEEPASEE